MREPRQKRLGIGSGLADPENVAILRNAFGGLLAYAGSNLVADVVLVFLDDVDAFFAVEALVKCQLILEVFIFLDLQLDFEVVIFYFLYLGVDERLGSLDDVADSIMILVIITLFDDFV